jgi:ABC-type thiamin/hydroxymethylpyrimidine transport system permease subunit
LVADREIGRWKNMRNFKKTNSRKLAVIILFSAMGAVASVAVGYAGNVLSFAPLGPIGGQLLAGLHVFWLILVAGITRSRGATIISGALKGTIEMVLPNHIGLFVFLISLLEGAVIELAFLPFKFTERTLVLIAAGFSSACNVFVLQAFQILPASLPSSVYVAMYGASFFSGLVLGGYLGVRSLFIIEKFIYKL